jgi:hypothetical protein
MTHMQDTTGEGRLLSAWVQLSDGVRCSQAASSESRTCPTQLQLWCCRKDCYCAKNTGSDRPDQDRLVKGAGSSQGAKLLSTSCGGIVAV